MRSVVTVVVSPSTTVSVVVLTESVNGLLLSLSAVSSEKTNADIEFSLSATAAAAADLLPLWVRSLLNNASINVSTGSVGVSFSKVSLASFLIASRMNAALFRDASVLSFLVRHSLRIPTTLSSARNFHLSG